MSTIASPRASTALSSRRTSTSTDRSASTSHQPPGPASGSLRRNRAALRDYYNLKTENPTTKTASDTSSVPPTPTEPESELDKPHFDPPAYISHILSTSGLEEVMRIEAGLVSDIRTLDGEKKALVYDNYSKLIAATDTIRKMRMGAPGTEELGPKIGHIVKSARAL